MYKYVACISQTKGSRPRLVNDDISAMQVADVVRSYTENRVIVTNTFLTKNVCLRLQDYYAELVAFSGTIGDWFSSLGNRALNTTDTLPNLTERHAKFSNLNAWWFNQKPTLIRSHPTTNYTFADAEDLLITKKGVDYKELFAKTLFTVNGYMHRSALSNDGIYILDACRDAWHANEVNTGALTFNNLSTLSIYPISEGDIYPPDQYSSLKEQMLLKLPFNAKGKSVALVVGGILYWQNDLLTLISDTTANFLTGRVDWVERFFYDRDYINLSSIPAEINPDSPYIIRKEVLESDAFLKSWLLLSQSFWVVFDNPLLYLEMVPLERHTWPGLFTVPTDEPVPVVLNNGVMAEPLLRPGEKRHRMLTRHFKKRGALNTTVGYKNEPIVTDYALMSDPWLNSNAYWLKIATF
ncbi:virion structural protein [Salmonella phage vB_SalM_SA002]|nr:virion structural protein [Salmonella phage vB_SalM_SA002]